MKNQAIVKAPRQKSLTLRMRPDQIKTIVESASAMLCLAMTEGSENFPHNKMREMGDPAYKEIAVELGRYTMRGVIKATKIHSLHVDMFPHLGYFHIYFVHDDGSHPLGQAWKFVAVHPSGRTLFEHRVEKSGLGAAIKEPKKL